MQIFGAKNINKINFYRKNLAYSLKKQTNICCTFGLRQPSGFSTEVPVAQSCE